MVCKPRNQGGLGLNNLKYRNHALLLKWSWKWFKDRNSFCWTVIQKKYLLKSFEGLEPCGNRRDLSGTIASINSLQKELWGPHLFQTHLYG